MTKHDAETAFRDLRIVATYKGDKPAPWSSTNPNRNLVTVFRDAHRMSFNFWGLPAEPCLTERRELLTALRMAMDDAMNGSDSFELFCEDYDYDPDSRKAYKIYRACKEMHRKFMRLYMDDKDAFDATYEALTEELEG